MNRSGLGALKMFVLKKTCEESNLGSGGGPEVVRRVRSDTGPRKRLICPLCDRFTLVQELHPDWMLLLFFTHTQLTVTVTLGLLLIPKVNTLPPEGVT